MQSPSQMAPEAQARGMPGRPRRRGPPLQSVDVEDVIQTDVVTTEADAEIASVVQNLEENDVGSVVVVRDDEPLGVLTDRKIALAIGDVSNITDTTAKELMSESLVTASTDDTIFDILQMMSDEAIRRMPVVDDQGNLEGIVTLDDVIVLLSAEFSNVAEVIKTQSPRL